MVRKPVKRNGKIVGYKAKANSTTTYNYNKSGRLTSKTTKMKH